MVELNKLDSMNTIIAIDPGAGGGIAVYGNGKVTAVKMPKTTKELQSYLNYIISTHKNITVFIEKVSAYRGDKSSPGKNFSINKLLANYSKLVTVVEILGLKYVEVYPVSWQTTLRLKSREKLTSTERKNKYKDYATNCFPEVGKVTLATADALCLVSFALHKISNDIGWIRERLKNKAVENLF